MRLPVRGRERALGNIARVLAGTAFVAMIAVVALVMTLTRTRIPRRREFIDALASARMSSLSNKQGCTDILNETLRL